MQRSRESRLTVIYENSKWISIQTPAYATVHVLCFQASAPQMSHAHTHMPTICRASVSFGPALASVKLNPQRLSFGNLYYVMKTHRSTCQFHHSSSCIAGICCGIGWLRFLWLFLHAKGVGSTMQYKALEHFMA